MDNLDIYEVSRAEYAAFVETIKPAVRQIKVQEQEETTITEIYSNLRNELLCARYSFKESPEKYYVINLPTAEESQPPVPKTQIVLETKEQVQTLMDALAKTNGGKNGRAIHKHTRRH